MCGINYIKTKNKINNLNDRICKMNIALNHRGPDMSGVFQIDKHTTLGHTRLSIIDVGESSKQPMTSNSNDIISFNGEIINYKSIRNSLKDLYDFKTNSDTEVILASYQLKGLDWTLSNLRGMFSFILYDYKLKETILVRDPFGIKPLYYSSHQNNFIASSEPTGILSSGLFNPTINHEYISEYLFERFVHAPNTLIKEIHQVKPGHYIKLDNEFNFKEYRYYKHPSLNQVNKEEEKSILKTLNNLIIKTIENWSISDVPLGTFLSGGLDSSLITSILSKKTKDLNTYTATFNSLNFDESVYAKKVSKEFKTNFKKIDLNNDSYIKENESFIIHKKLPISVPNEIPLYFLSKKMKSKITVALSGEGADEFFGGYGRIMKSFYDFEKMNTSVKSFKDYFFDKYDYTPNKIIKILGISTKWKKERDASFEKLDSKSNKNLVLEYFQKRHLEGLLSRVDFSSMKASIESRPVFVDIDLIKYVNQNIPFDLKIKWNENIELNKDVMGNSKEYSEKLDTPKYILKKVAENHLTKDIIYRNKLGFPVPLNEYYSIMIKYVEELITDSSIFTFDINDYMKSVEKINNYGQITWMVWNLLIWEKKVMKKNYKW